MFKALWSFFSKTKAGKATGGVSLGGGVFILMMTYTDAQMDHVKENLTLKYDGLQNEVRFRNKQVNKDISEINSELKLLNKNIMDIIKNK